MSISSIEVRLITNLLKEIQYGSVSIAVNEGKITEVESLKKKRFDTKKKSKRYVR